ncbi:uncharacterized protein Z520_08738 [Fonsecaea multimorphosa CBS 102226]|uniref:AT hook motif protein n=1 Tax=Fonsecaea multimorphosa CBS 102226 TaxID=1442371 RepID=A0A0D2KG20_9EURO|nr:uncharacterized protein Z520_08738 [Fonsecaea multimorphosa CBS 102226]KIX95618.1 hypothetical protein Z520_08738 [Fonsecaea multimorphosa CBS 102226]OAL21222.1 hypothetical protein AYO22_08185 [Fonsecaea multimorphosa]
MPMTWDADADARLFAAVLATSEIKIDYPAVAARMGNGCSAKAVTHRITNIKNKAKSLEDGDAPLPTPAASNGAAGGRKRGPNKAKSTKANDSEDADGAAAKPAAKKRKTTANGAKSAGTKKATAPEAAEPVKKDEEEDENDEAVGSDEEAKDEESA